jgi:CelD/BcsL family acetyltransferase involved in cellulose biosynthesis
VKVEPLAGFDALDEARWNGLLGRSAVPSVFLTWQWQTRWAEAFVSGRPLALLAVSEEGGGLAGLLPLYEDGAGTLRPIGGTDVSDYLDLIAPAGLERPVWEALLAYREGRPGAWALRGLRAASPTLGLVPALAPGYGLRARVQVEERCPVLALPDSWDVYLARLSGKERHELRRKMRRLEGELPGTRVRALEGGPGWEAGMTAFLRLHRASREGKARFMDQRMEGFFRGALAALARKGWARLWFLEADEGPLAAFICLEYGGTVGLYNSGFDPARARLSPGIVLLAHVIRDAIARRVPVFDFLRGEEPYKYAFGPVPTDLFALELTA